MRTRLMASLSLVAVTALVVPALAASVEPRVQLLVRERPSTSARIVDRVPPGRKLPLLGRTGDGLWAHVQTAKRDGWVPSEQLKGMVKARKANTVESDDDDQVADEEEVRKPLAKRRNVRPEAWVSSSRYHDGEDNKLTISTTKAELYGRPQTGGSVLGILRRGEVVSLVRKSSDKRWCLVDIGGGDVAWIEAKTVKPGAAKGAPIPQAEIAEEEAPRKRKRMVEVREEPPVEEEAPPPPPTRKPRKVVREEVVEREPEPEPEAAPEPPPPPVVKKTKRQLAAERAAEERASREADAARDNEQAPMPNKASNDLPDEERPQKKSRKRVRLASRDLSGVGADTSVSRSRGAPHGANYFGLGVRGGLAIINQRFTSNGTGALSNYEANTNALGIIIGAGYMRAIGQYFRIGLDLSYAFAGAAAVRYHTTDGSDPLLGVQNHVIDGGLGVGVHFNAIGGVDIRLRLGGEMQLNLIQASTKVPLPSDRVVGMTIGLAIDAPALFYLANRAVGLHVYGGGLVPADRAQTVGLEEGGASTTFGAAFGGYLSYNLYKGLGLDAAYSYSFAATHFNGQAKRNLTITSADRGSAQHLITLGLSYSL